MSLVGSLEDLGLADILQILSLSRKSGLLLLRSDAGEGRILVGQGLVRAASVKGEPEDLRGLLVAQGLLSEREFDAARAEAERRREDLDAALARRAALEREGLDALRREHAERSVLRMFAWRRGGFSFEVGAGGERDLPGLALAEGIQAQYLAMEATRLGDEAAGDAPAEGEALFSGEAPGGGSAGARAALDRLALESARRADREEGGEPGAAAETRARAAESPPSPARRPLPPPRLVAIDPDLGALEWLKSVLAERFASVHIFQDPEAGVARVRQILGRGELPLVLVAAEAPGGPAGGGAEAAADLVLRLRSLAPRMPIVVLEPGLPEEPTGKAPSLLPPGLEGADARVRRPASARLAEPGRWRELAPAGAALARALRRFSASAAEGEALRRPAAAPERVPPPAPPSELELRELRAACDRLRAAAARGEVLSAVLDFAAARFSRVALFLLREQVAVGVAQRGLARAGGPGDAELRQLRVPAAEVDWFRLAIESRRPVEGPPRSERDRSLAALLGSRVPRLAWVAPLENLGRVSALLYADMLPEERPFGDPAGLEILLGQAALTLDRILLQRALAEADAGGREAVPPAPPAGVRPLPEGD
jgi:hypothetical protein